MRDGGGRSGARTGPASRWQNRVSHVFPKNPKPTLHRLLLFSLVTSSAFAADAPPAKPAFQPRPWFLADGRDVEAVLVTADPAKDGVRVGLKTADGKALDAAVAVQDGHSLRYLENVRLAEGREFREWHFDKLPKELADFPATVRGAFVRVVCEDHQFSTA